MFLECSICLEPLLGEDIHKTHCNHLFHRECLVNSQRYTQRCPLCRRDLDVIESKRCIWKSFNECKDFDIEIINTGYNGNEEWIFAKVFNSGNIIYTRYFFTMYGMKKE